MSIFVRRKLLPPTLLLAAFLAARAAPSPVAPSPAAVNIDTDTVLVQRYTGPGVQWDPSDYAYTDAQWTRIFRRVDALHPSFIRCCLGASFYCTGFDARGKPIYAWDTPGMGRLYRILDYCQKRHVEVLMGEWGPDFGMTTDDPRWSNLIGDCLEHLVRVKGYTCIKYYNKQNEPRGTALLSPDGRRPRKVWRQNFSGGAWTSRSLSLARIRRGQTCSGG